MNLPASRVSLSSPPTTRSVRNRMGWLLIAVLPGIAGRVREAGVGLLLQLALALGFALLVDALLLRVHGQLLRAARFEGSTAVTAVLFALCLPMLAPWWVIALGIGAALVFGQFLYGGLGRNPFHPAMLGIALLLVCLPGTWAPVAPTSHLPGDHAWIRIAALDALGGAWLVWLRIVRWQTPLAVLAGAALGAALLGFAAHAPTLRELFAGNLVLAAFFIASDPVSGCVTPLGRWVFGLGVGLLLVLLQRIGTLSIGLPFAVLLMNGAAPWIDRRMQPARLAEQPHG